MATLNIFQYSTSPPPEPSPRLEHWRQKILHGWRPNRRISQMGYDAKSAFFGVYVWEYLNVLAPLLREKGAW